MTAAPSISHLASAGELVAAKKFDEAEAAILRALDGAPSDTKALNLLALVRYKLGRLADARDTYRQIVAATPQDADARRNLGLLALKLGDVEEALPALEMAVRVAPTDARAWSYLGYAFAKRGEVVEAAAAFRRAGQDALAVELEQAAKAQRPGRRASGTQPGPSGPELARGMPKPVALAPPLPPLVSESPSGVRRQRRVQPPPPEAEVPAPAPAAEPPAPIEAVPVPLVVFVRARLGRAQALPATRGALRLTVADEVHVRADAVLAGTGALHWDRGVRRAQGRLTSEPLGTSPAQPFFRLTGAGAVWVAGAPDRWLPVRLADDVLYVREDRVLAFEGALAWESGSVSDTGVPMLQFRGKGTVALELPRDAIALEVAADSPALVSAPRLYGWVGRLVPHAAGERDNVPFQLTCDGEGIVLLEAAG
ncbi:MAG TPA: tetratricopeptide repeat protein [Polyangia bacterium]|nr:tetratricopeptide repeat protein [Polyangia bacterium]